MLFLKILITSVQLILGLTPVGISLFAIQQRSWQLAVWAVVAVFAVVAILPLFRRRESLWVFFLMFLTLTPIDVYAIVKLLCSSLFVDSFLITNILRGGILFLIGLSVEELICGLIARLLWRKQYRTVALHV